MSLSRSIVHSITSSADPLEGKRFTFGELANLFQVYAQSGTVKGISVRGYKLSNAACAEIGNCLRTLKRRVSLMDFAYCAMGDNGALAVLRALADAQHGGEVHELVLRLCRLSPDFGREAGKIFFHGSGRNSSGLKDTGMRPFGNLRALDLSFNSLGCAGVASIIRHAPAGIQLDLSFTGLDIDSCQNLSQLDSALASTEASSILLFGAGDTVTSHLFRQRHLSQTRKNRQQLVDAKCLLASENPDSVQTVTNGITDATIRTDLQFCRFGGPSVTLYLDGDLGADEGEISPEDYTETQKYLASENHLDEGDGAWTDRLLREVVTFVGEPIFRTPAYKSTKNYPSFVRGEISGVYRVRDGRSSTVFSARSASCITQRSNSPYNNNNTNRSPSTSRRSMSASGQKQNNNSTSSRSGSVNNNNYGGFTNSFAQNRRSASASSFVRTASKLPHQQNRSTSANRDGNNSNSNSRSVSIQQQQQQQNQNDRSISIVSYPDHEQDLAAASSSSNDACYGRTASVLSTLTTTSTNVCRPVYRTPFERDAPPVLNGNKNKHANDQDYQDRQRDLSALLSPRSVSQQQQQQQQQQSPATNDDQQLLGASATTSRSIGTTTTSATSPRVILPTNNNNTNKIDRVASHLSSDKVVRAGRNLAPLTGPTLVTKKDMTATNKRQLMQQLLKACVVSESQCEKIFGLPNTRDYLGPHALPPITFSAFPSSSSPFQLLTPEQQLQKRQDLSHNVPSFLLEANGVPSWLIKQPPGSEARVAGIAKILFYLSNCSLSNSENTENDNNNNNNASSSSSAYHWVTHSNTVDLPEFLRHFGDGQRTVVQFRSQRQREDKGAQAIVDSFMKNRTSIIGGRSSSSAAATTGGFDGSVDNSVIVG